MSRLHWPVAAARQDFDRVTVQSIIEFLPTRNRICSGVVEHYRPQQPVVNLPPPPFRHGQIHDPPDDDFDREQKIIVNQPKNHQSADVERKADRRQRHQHTVESRLGQFFLFGVMTRTVERIKVEDGCDLVVNQ